MISAKELRKMELVAYAAIRNAGAEVMKVYMDFKRRGKLQIESKSDDTPLTSADKLSHETLVRHLDRFYPVLSEEDRHHTDERTYFLIDPLDGTKEFIDKSNEFCINIALIHNKKVILGLICAPYFGVVFSARKGGGVRKNGKPFAVRQRSQVTKGMIKAISSAHHEGLRANRIPKTARHAGTSTRMNARVVIDMAKKGRAAGSKSDKKFARFCREYGLSGIAAGSSLKFIKLAESKCDVYPRFQHSKEWDIAPGIIILQELGGNIVELEVDEYSSNIRLGAELAFGKASVENPPFIAYRDEQTIRKLVGDRR